MWVRGRMAGERGGREEKAHLDMIPTLAVLAPAPARLVQGDCSSA